MLNLAIDCSLCLKLVSLSITKGIYWYDTDEKKDGGNLPHHLTNLTLIASVTSYEVADLISLYSSLFSIPQHVDRISFG